MTGSRILPALLVLLAVFCTPGASEAQAAAEWNSEPARELIDRARRARRQAGTDPDFRGYRARAEGHVYFLVDRGDATDRTLVKADQLALEVFWRAPGLERQHIVGRRDERQLPTRIRYHLDHLTVVTDDFGDRITVGEGDEVRSVTHPLAPGSAEVYDFRVADSLTVTFPPGPDSVRVYEIEIRPRDVEEPGVVGSVFVDRITGGVVRFAFTFTPASYVDPQLDYIRISLHNGRWEGRYWLPHRQEIEIRRELHYLDVPAGSVIRGRYEIGDYELNPDFPPDIFVAPRVTLASSGAELEDYPFRRGLYAELDEEGLSPTPDIQDLRRRAVEMAGAQYARRVGGLRVSVPSASSVLRHNRAEGTRLAGGVSYETGGGMRLRLGGGWAFARERPSFRTEVTGGGERPVRGIRVSWNELRDLGPVSAASGAVNSLSVLLFERDYLDPYFTSGLELFQRSGHGGGPIPDAKLTLRVERHAAASYVLSTPPGSSGHRAVRPVDEGLDRAVELALHAGASSTEDGLSARGRATLGRFADAGYAEARTRLGWTRTRLATDTRLRADLRAGIVSPGAPAQSLYNLGGRGTLPGHGYRAAAGNWYWLLRLEGSRGVAAPWLRPRAFAAVGATGLAGHQIPDAWDAGPAPAPRVSVGVGAGLFWDVLRIDLARGLGDGDWQANLSVNHSFWPWL